MSTPKRAGIELTPHIDTTSKTPRKNVVTEWPNIGKTVWTNDGKPVYSYNRRYVDEKTINQPPKEWRVISETRAHLVMVAAKAEKGEGIVNTKTVEKREYMGELYETERDVWIARLDVLKENVHDAEKELIGEIKSVAQKRIALKKCRELLRLAQKKAGLKG